ncbi:MAG TPA: protein phosphatase 2C domain-containing protein [Beutenbergiaceae bacterium]|nr:protein phosphatase 2C domain-containing protein [Beutenbergiaceae bacterium]
MSQREERVVQTLWGAVTDAGGRRRVNEDAVLARPPVFVVADGMGGHVYGAMASACVVQAFAEFADQTVPGTPVEPAQINAVIHHAQNLIRAKLRALDDDRPARAQASSEGQSKPESGGSPSAPLAGTTVAGAVLTSRDGTPYWLVFNIGDSRVYRHDETGLSQISVDHSVVQELIDAGTITADAARSHPERNVITRAVDSARAVQADFWMLHAGEEQTLLLCSDGLVGELTAEEIGDILNSPGDPDKISRDLLHRAIDGGARDNVSAVVVRLQMEYDDAGWVHLPAWDEDLDDTLPRPGAEALR